MGKSGWPFTLLHHLYPLPPSSAASALTPQLHSGEVSGVDISSHNSPHLNGGLQTRVLCEGR